MLSLAEDMNSLDREHLKDFVRGLLEKVELDAEAATFQLTYRLNAGDRVASPRLGQSNPGNFAWLWTRVRA